MAEIVSLRVTGSAELRRALERLDGREREIAQERALRAAANMVAAQAKVYAPFVTGFLRNSIQVDEVDATHAVIAPHTDYALFVEFGTSRRAPKPYMRPAISQHETEIVRLIEQHIVAFVEDT